MEIYTNCVSQTHKVTISLIKIGKNARNTKNAKQYCIAKPGTFDTY